MDKQTHTPGPWDWDGYIITADAGNPRQPIATVNQFLPEFRAEGAANARLIAAAPELLAALKGLVGEINNLVEEGTLPDGAYVHPSMVAAKNAIAKAEGR